MTSTLMPGSTPLTTSVPLAELLDARREDILERWVKRVEGHVAPGGLSRSELVNSMPDFLREIVATLRRHVPGSGVKAEPAVDAIAQQHGEQRYRVGSDINSVVWEYGVLRDVLLEFIAETEQALPAWQWHVISHAITGGIAVAVGHFAREREKALRASEERLRAIMDHAPAYIYLKDAEGRYLLANRPWEKTFHGGQDVKGKTDAEVFPRETAEVFRANDLRVIESSTSVEAEEQVLEADGVHTYLSLKFPLRDSEGRPYAVCGISTDITARKRLEAERQRALDTLEHGDACFVLDRDWRFVLVNQNQERLSQTRREQTLGRVFWEVFPLTAAPDSPYWREYHRVMDERVEVSFEAYYAPLDLWTGVTAYPLRTGEIAVFFRDISERRRAEAARDFFLEAGRVLASSLELDEMLRSLASMVARRLADCCVVDLLGEDGRLRRQAATRHGALEPLLERVMAYPPPVESDRPLIQVMKRGELLAIPEVTPQWIEAFALNAEHRTLLEALELKSAIIVPLVAQGRKLGIISLVWTRQHTVSVKWYLEVARGVADQAAVAIDNARLYQEAQAASRVREEVMAIVSHDLRTPLGAISLSAETLLRRKALNPVVAQGLRRISAASARATRLISELLDFTQARVGALPLHPKAADFHERVRQVVEEVQLAHPERDIRVETVGDGQGAWDVERVAQVISNMVGNAVQHSPPDTPVRVTSRCEGEEVVLTVNNQGAPIPPELLPTLFEPFWRGKAAEPQRGSVGLGLYISRQVVLGHGGRIDVSSSKEEGTTFTIRLPRYTVPRPVPPAG